MILGQAAAHKREVSGAVEVQTDGGTSVTMFATN